MYYKIIINFFLIGFLVIFQLSFIRTLPGWFMYLDIIIVFLVYIVSLAQPRTIWWWIIGTGMLLDFLAFTPFGFHLLGVSVMAVVVYYLKNSYFTNRSLYSFLALTVSATLSYGLLRGLLNIISALALSMPLEVFTSQFFWLAQGRVIIMNLIFSVLFFYLITIFTKRYRPVFID
ncbi:hypothetical protein KAJ89_02145 [Candidatus Parcubacteria bacterium]|nr:hypothetical protein [Candidatus Parcubacteria bacterium]